MDSTPDISDDDALKQRRQRLRALADRLLEATESIPLPDTFLEAERAHKAVRACDTLLVQLYSDPRPPAPNAPHAKSASKRANPVDDEDDADDDLFADLPEVLRAEILQYGYDRPETKMAEASTPRPENPRDTPHRSTDPPP